MRFLREDPARSIRFVSNSLLALAGISTLLMMVHTVLDVAVRYFLPYVLPATIDVVGYYYMIGTIMLGLAATELAGSHLRVESLDLITPPFYKRASLIFGEVISLSFMGVLSYGAMIRLLSSYQTNEVTFGHHPITLWPSRLIFVVGIVGFLIVAAWRLWRVARHGEEIEPTSDSQGAGSL